MSLSRAGELVRQLSQGLAAGSSGARPPVPPPHPPVPPHPSDGQGGAANIPCELSPARHSPRSCRVWGLVGVCWCVQRRARTFPACVHGHGPAARAHAAGCGPEFWMYITLCVSLVAFAALMAGLTVALMSLGLCVLCNLPTCARPRTCLAAASVALPPADAVRNAARRRHEHSNHRSERHGPRAQVRRGYLPAPQKSVTPPCLHSLKLLETWGPRTVLKPL